MTLSRIAFLAAAFAGLLGVSASAGEMVLAERGREPLFAIETGPSPATNVAYAAAELAAYVERMTGVALPVVEKVGEGRGAVRLVCRRGLPAEEDDAFRLVARDGSLVVEGGGRGVLYGVYELLEEYGGVGWFASWCEVVPQLDVFAVPDDLDVSQRPAMAMRFSGWYDNCGGRDPAFTARLRFNGPWNIPPGKSGERYGGSPYRFCNRLPIAHTFGSLLPPSVHFRDHPEWFSEVGGRRVGAPGERTQLCLTNPEVLRRVTDEVLKRLRADPGAKFCGVSQNDWEFWCTCTNCAAVDAEEGSHAGTVIRFVNAVAEAVEKEFPDVYVQTLAYLYTRKPPAKTRPRHNVVPCLCDISCDFSKPFGVSPDADNQAFVRDIAAWSAISDRLFVWDYQTSFLHYLYLFPNAYTICGNLRFFRDNKVSYIFEQGGGRHADFAELKIWLTSKMAWDPDQPVEPLIDRFMEGYYGAAAPFVRQYFDEAQAVGAPPGIYAGVYTPLSNKGYVKDDFLVRATDLWAKAAEAVKDDPARAYNVRMGAASPLYTIVERGPARFHAFVTRHPERLGIPAAKAGIRELVECRKASGDKIQWSEGRDKGILARWERVLNLPDNPGPMDRAVIGGAGGYQIAKKGLWGQLVSKEVAGSEYGWAVRLFNTHTNLTAAFPMSNVAFDEGGLYGLRVHAKVARKPDGAGEAFRIVVRNDAARTTAAEKSFDVEEVQGDGYAWYDAFEWKAAAGQTLWFGPGRFAAAVHRESPCVKDVTIDAIEISRRD